MWQKRPRVSDGAADRSIVGRLTWGTKRAGLNDGKRWIRGGPPDERCRSRSSRGGVRTRTGVTPHRILSPVRLPIPPLGQRRFPGSLAGVVRFHRLARQIQAEQRLPTFLIVATTQFHSRRRRCRPESFACHSDECCCRAGNRLLPSSEEKGGRRDLDLPVCGRFAHSGVHIRAPSPVTTMDANPHLRDMPWRSPAPVPGARPAFAGPPRSRRISRRSGSRARKQR